MHHARVVCDLDFVHLLDGLDGHPISDPHWEGLEDGLQVFEVSYLHLDPNLHLPHLFLISVVASGSTGRDGAGFLSLGRVPW